MSTAPPGAAPCRPPMCQANLPFGALCCFSLVSRLRRWLGRRWRRGRRSRRRCSRRRCSCRRRSCHALAGPLLLVLLLLFARRLLGLLLSLCVVCCISPLLLFPLLELLAGRTCPSLPGRTAAGTALRFKCGSQGPASQPSALLHDGAHVANPKQPRGDQQGSLRAGNRGANRWA